MKVKLDHSSKFWLLTCFLISSQVSFIRTAKSTFLIERFGKSSSVVGKSRAEAEMAYFTQQFFFIHKTEVLGQTMLKFLRKYVEIQKGNEVSQNLHWTEEEKNMKSDRYKHRSNYCFNYLLDQTLQESGIQYDPDPFRIIESEMSVTFDYYTRIHRKHYVLQCPVIVNQQRSQLFFMRFSKESGARDKSYFVLASTSQFEIASLYVLMYTTRKVAKGKEKKSLLVNVPLSSIEEEQVLEEHTSTDQINFRRIIKVRRESTGSATNVWFGKAAERVFITSNNFYFVNLTLGDWFVDKFIQLMETLRKENQVQFSRRSDDVFKSQVCKGHIKYNPALSLRDYTPDVSKIGDGRGIEMVTRKTSFPHTQLPEFEFKVPMLACPALFGPQEESKMVYLQLIEVANTSNWVFALLESKRNPGTVYPATFSLRNRAFDRLSFESTNEVVPPIDEDSETSQSTEETSAGPSTSRSVTL